MTREEARAAAQVLLAYAGEDLVEFKLKGSATSAWTLQHDNDRWDFENRDYRIKPKPREWNAIVYPTGAISGHTCNPPNPAGHEIIKVREVIQ